MLAETLAALCWESERRRRRAGDGRVAKSSSEGQQGHRTMVVRIILAAVCVTMLASPSSADEFDRPGWYVGAGGGVAFNFLSEFVANQTMGVVDLEDTGTVNVRGGYRLLSWLAFEGMYEGAYNYDIVVAGSQVASRTTNSLLVNTKLIVPTWRIQPYLGLGIGGQQGRFQAGPVLGRLDSSRWDLVLRIGLGVDAYLTEHWLVNVELAPSIRLTDYGDIPSESTDNASLTLSCGIQYRF
jgi:opacity protein-like surface antigen